MYDAGFGASSISYAAHLTDLSDPDAQAKFIKHIRDPVRKSSRDAQREDLASEMGVKRAKKDVAGEAEAKAKLDAMIAEDKAEIYREYEKMHGRKLLGDPRPRT